MPSFLQGKKIVAYVALKHHTRFIVPIMEKLAQLGACPQYIVGQAERSQEITAIETGLNYTHVYDYLSPEDDDESHQIYLTLRDGFVKGMKKDIAIGASVMPTILDKSLYNISKEYIGFRNFFQVEKPDLCLALHEVNRWGKMMGFWAKQNNVPFYSFIEGLSNADDYLYIGHTQYSCFNLVWGETMRKKLIEFEAPKDRIIPVGNTHLATEKENMKKNNTRQVMKKKYHFEDQQVISLLFSAMPSPIDEILPLLQLNTELKNKKIIVKFHPVTTVPIIEQWLEPVSQEIKDATLMIHGQETVYSLIAMSDLVVISEPSTTGLESVFFEKPLVQLKLEAPDQYPYTFVEDGVAAHLSPTELTQIIRKSDSFDQFIDPIKINSFLQKELADTSNSINTIVDIFNQAIRANQHAEAASFSFRNESKLDWSIILPVGSRTDYLIQVLESIANFSDGNGNFEVILVEQENTPGEIKAILDTLEGDVQRIVVLSSDNLSTMFNKAATYANGDKLIFLDYAVAPTNDWLKNIQKEFDLEDVDKIIGGRVISIRNNIVHAGMAVDWNNSPVSAYLHLDDKFPPAMKRRRFQMINHFIAIQRDFFLSLNGFDTDTGTYCFLDLCLKANSVKINKGNQVIYNPEIKLIKIGTPDNKINFNEAIYFYSRWHGNLIDSENALYKEDGISQLQLDSARMTRAMETAGE